MLGWWLGQGVSCLCAFVMSSSSESLSPVQWLFSQVSNNFGLSKPNQPESFYSQLTNCNCETSPSPLLGEYSDPFLNFEVPFSDNLNFVHTSSSALHNILKCNTFPKPLNFLSCKSPNQSNCNKQNYLGNCVLSEVNCLPNCFSHTSSSNPVILRNPPEVFFESNSCTEPIEHPLQGTETSCGLVAQDRMVTSSLSSNVSCNVNPVVDKRKIKVAKQQSPTKINQTRISGYNKKAKENTKNWDNSGATETKKDLNFKKKGSEKDNNIGFVKPTNLIPGANNCDSDNEKSDPSTCLVEEQKSPKHENESSLKEVGKILHEVLRKSPYQNQGKTNYAVAEVSSGGTDTGYSSRCSTPPTPANLAETSSDPNKRDVKSSCNETGRIPLVRENTDQNHCQSRSESPSECSDSSGGSYYSYKERNHHSYQQRFNGFHHQKPIARPNHFLPPFASGNEENYQRQCNENGFIGGRVRGQGNNGAFSHYRKMDRVSFQQCQPSHLSHHNSSHPQDPQNGGRYMYNNRPFNQVQFRGQGRGHTWGFNQRFHNGKNRQYGNPNHTNHHIPHPPPNHTNHHIPHPPPNHHFPHHNGHVQNFPPNGTHNSNLYYQMNSQFDLRETVWKFHRKLSDEAGTFTAVIGNHNERWVKDHRAEATIIPPELLCDREWDKLSLQVWNLFTKHQQLESTFRAKMELKERISHVIWNVLPTCRLFVVGSSLSGFGANSSDVDMCIMVTPRDLDQRNEAQAVLRLLQRELNNCGFVEKMELITAKVPILKFRDSRTNIDVDLNCNNSVGIRNTHLLNAYSQLDWRVRPLVLVAKLWAQHHHINNAKDMTISSYSLVLMVIHYLQYGLKTALLPCLHKAYPDKFNGGNHVFRMPVTERLPVFISNNTQSIGELFLGFLRYYSNEFTFIENTISVRTGGILPTKDCRNVKSKKNDSRVWKYLCIEEPFDLTNTARSVYDEVIFEKVKNVFKDSYSLLEESRDLNTIFA